MRQTGLALTTLFGALVAEVPAHGRGLQPMRSDCVNQSRATTVFLREGFNTVKNLFNG